VLFDLDGTLVDSGASVVRAWQWVADQLERPFSLFAPYVHGIPADQVFETVVPEVSGAQRADLVERMLSRQAEDTVDVFAIPGALDALDALPTPRWAIVTSGDLRLASSRIEAAGLPRPRVLITADDVQLGKPHPAPYLLAAARLRAEPGRCLVVEDAPAGVQAAAAATMTVLGVLTSASRLAGVAHAVGDLTAANFTADRLGVHVVADF
jgi:sugar-phosphatase